MMMDIYQSPFEGDAWASSSSLHSFSNIFIDFRARELNIVQNVYVTLPLINQIKQARHRKAQIHQSLKGRA